MGGRRYYVTSGLLRIVWFQGLMVLVRELNVLHGSRGLKEKKVLEYVKWKLLCLFLICLRKSCIITLGLCVLFVLFFELGSLVTPGLPELNFSSLKTDCWDYSPVPPCLVCLFLLVTRKLQILLDIRKGNAPENSQSCDWASETKGISSSFGKYSL